MFDFLRESLAGSDIGMGMAALAIVRSNGLWGCSASGTDSLMDSGLARLQWVEGTLVDGCRFVVPVS